MPIGYVSKRVGETVTSEHRYVMEQYLGRKLRRNEYVHHINGDKRDNHIENLMVMTPQEHNDLHNTKYPKTKVCAICGKEFTPPINHRARNSICSKNCIQEWYKMRGEKERKRVEQYSLDGKHIKTFPSIKEAGLAVNGCGSNIVKALKGKTNSAYGYKWAYSV